MSFKITSMGVMSHGTVETMDCRKIDLCLGRIAGLAEGAHKAIGNGDSLTVEMKMREIEKQIKNIRAEQAKIGLTS